MLATATETTERPELFSFMPQFSRTDQLPVTAVKTESHLDADDLLCLVQSVRRAQAMRRLAALTLLAVLVEALGTPTAEAAPATQTDGGGATDDDAWNKMAMLRLRLGC